MKQICLKYSTILLVIVLACQEKPKKEQANVADFIEGDKRFSLANPPAPEKETTIFGKKKPEPFVNEELPKTYTSRKVIKGLAGLSYNIFYLPGNIVRYDSVDSNYVVVTAKSILRNSQLPKVEVIQDGVLYSNSINNTASFNASAFIGGLSVGSEQMMELIIQDVSVSIAPDSLFDTSSLSTLISKIPAGKRNKYFFVRSSLLALVNSKKYSKTDFSAKVNISYVTAEGKVFSSKDKFSKERVVSLDLVSFDDLIDRMPNLVANN